MDKRPKSAPSTESEPSHTPTPHKSGSFQRVRRVLIVDDTRDTREMYCEFFQMSGFQVVLAEDGNEALKKAIKDAPDAIVMDLAMPLVDGLETTKRLKMDARTRHIPVVVVTGNGLQSCDKATQLGCAAYLTKPCLPDDLVGVVESVLSPPPRIGVPEGET